MKKKATIATRNALLVNILFDLRAKCFTPEMKGRCEAGDDEHPALDLAIKTRFHALYKEWAVGCGQQKDAVAKIVAEVKAIEEAIVEIVTTALEEHGAI